MKILQRAKNVLKRFYPPPVDVFNREIRKLSNAIVEADEKISVKVAAFSNSATQHLQGIAQEQAQIAETLTALHHRAAQQKDEIVAELRSQSERQKREVTAELQDQVLRQQDVLTAELHKQSILQTDKLAELQKQGERWKQELIADLHKHAEQQKQGIITELDERDERRYQGVVSKLQDQAQSWRNELTCELQKQAEAQKRELVTDLHKQLDQQKQALAAELKEQGKRQKQDITTVFQNLVTSRKNELDLELKRQAESQKQEVIKQLNQQKQALAAELEEQGKREKQDITTAFQNLITSRNSELTAELQKRASLQENKLTELQEQNTRQKNELSAELQSQFKQQTQNLASEIQKLLQIGEKLCSELQKQFSLYETKLSEQNALIDQVNRQSVISSRNASEAVWAEIFNNAITGSEWLTGTAFSPGRWAVGYPYLYVMYRVLNEVHPRNIFELGLGQSTRMIAQYAAYYKARHQIVEHDPEWIEFFARSFKLSPSSSIVTLDRELVPYKEAEAVRVFKDFSKTFAGQHFDFISIDAPLGSDVYSRIDVLQLLPDCLVEDFVIMLDDCERPGENHTWEEMKRMLDRHGIKYSVGAYPGKKDCRIMSSESLKFVCSL